MYNQSFKGIGDMSGYMFAGEQGQRQSMTIRADHEQVMETDGGKVVPAGAVIPSNDGNAVGILIESVNVSNGDAAGAVMLSGSLYTDRLPGELTQAAREALAAGGFTFYNSGVTRPY